MAPSARLFCAPPLCSSDSFVAAEIRSRTSPGKRWALVRWVDFWLRLQVSHYHICKFNSCSSYALPYAHLCAVAKLFLVLFGLLNVAARSEFPDLPTMPRLRQRMSCRRGSSQGKAVCQASSSTTDSSTFGSDFHSDHYLATRSGRGWGRGQLNRAACSLNSSTNTARLQFPCTHDNFSFMASVTIELSKITSCQVAVSLGVTMETMVVDRHGTI